MTTTNASEREAALREAARFLGLVASRFLSGRESAEDLDRAVEGWLLEREKRD